LIIISLEDWDYKMQIECAQAFIAPVKAKVITNSLLNIHIDLE
jgi:hypothetical protein